jgi:hypothetical protein
MENLRNLGIDGKSDIREIWCEDADWIHLFQGRVHRRAP